MVLISITLMVNGEPISTAVLTDVVWSAATADDRLEHLTAQARPDRLHLGMYIRTAAAGDALATAHGIWHRAAARSPVLQRLEALPAVGPVTGSCGDN